MGITGQAYAKIKEVGICQVLWEKQVGWID